MKRQILLFIVTLLLTIQTNAQLNQKYTKEQWLEDLEYLVTNLKEHHPNLYYRISETDFSNAIENSITELENSKTDIESYFILKRLLAKIQDGHTLLYDAGVLGLSDLMFPYKLNKFSDGIFITSVHEDYQEYLGAEIVKINGITVENVLEITSNSINKDSKFGKIYSSINELSFPLILQGMGVINDMSNIQISLITNKGKQEEVKFQLVKDYDQETWLDITTILGKEIPLHLKKQGDKLEYFWFEHLEKDSTIYFQYNQVYRQYKQFENWYDFIERFWQYIDNHENEINKLIIDIRYNSGGNGRILYPFINHIIKRDKYRQGDNLFVLIGNRTNSAAVNLINELEVHTDAIFIGSPPSHPFNFFSNSKNLGTLPHSGIYLFVSSRQIDNAWCNQTDYFSPDIPALFSSKDYFSGSDPGLEIAINYTDNLTIIEYTIKNGADDAFDYISGLKLKNKDFDWWFASDPEKLENIINIKGYNLLKENKHKEAFELLKLNTLLFPDSFNVWDSFALWYYTTKNYKEAKINYQKSIDINPKNTGAQRAIDEIEKSFDN